MVRNPGGPRTGGSCSSVDFPLQLEVQPVLTPCPVPVCTDNSHGPVLLAVQHLLKREKANLFESKSASVVFQIENKPDFLLTGLA